MDARIALVVVNEALDAKVQLLARRNAERGRRCAVPLQVDEVAPPLKLFPLVLAGLQLIFQLPPNRLVRAQPLGLLQATASVVLTQQTGVLAVETQGLCPVWCGPSVHEGKLAFLRHALLGEDVGVLQLLGA
eukprot:CAMPEP_0180438190 /NCGR_PEP_ID=MMETSP1036_2-20121128/11936_1 /TAXON_ID=632150 /ORGANISM="Azadinium spinosum, Strain 3D9" /LENGTH=131 /DNA_ID=CAMNT_0022444273 /DNA_START=310 /DNA_END=705 /DNA_ORIENTATION=+